MRLLDLIAQTHEPFVVEQSDPPRQRRLQGTLDLAPAVLACPLRYVLTDELAALCAELAYSSGDRLVRCLDLVRFPAPSLWIEWADAAALDGAAGFFGEHAAAAQAGRRVGLLVQDAADGRRAVLRAFWSQHDEAVACPMEALMDLEPANLAGMCAGGGYRRWMAVSETVPAIAELMSCARFRMESSWAEYYEQAAAPGDQGRVVRDTLAGVARDVPVLIAFLLLLASREGVSVRPVSWDALNRKRARQGRAPLLNHVEACLALAGESAGTPSRAHRDSARFGPRRHHVRGHLVRHRDQVYWRRPHFRGNAFHGAVLSRTVRLSFERAAMHPA